MPSEPVQKHKYRVPFIPSAWAEWQALDGSVKETLRKQLKKRLDNPHAPGGVYRVQDDSLLVIVMAVDKREASAAYQSAMALIAEMVSEFAKATAKRD